MTALRLDKKRQETGVPFVLLPRLGEAVIREDVPLPTGGGGLGRDYGAMSLARTGTGSNADLLYWTGPGYG